jgi:hypothetical protein
MVGFAVAALCVFAQSNIPVELLLIRCPITHADTESCVMTPNPDAPSGLGPVTRRSLLAGSVGVASTLAVSGGIPAIAAADSSGAPVPIAPPRTPIPADPVIAYVHDSERGEVTLISGHHELTYRDPELAARLIAAAPTTTTAVR